MKVYRGYDGKLRLFRPDKNCARFVMSSARVALPTFNPLELEKLLKAFMKVDGPSEPSQCRSVLSFADNNRMAAKKSTWYLSVSPSGNHW
jgi:branched-subunit amino acid aminotransferase/4-amino-4-deoxychorismate lyase